MNDALVTSVRHYLDRTRHILARLAEKEDADKRLTLRLAPDMFDTGFNFAIAIQFAARALCPPAGREVPEIPDHFTVQTLLAYTEEIATTIAPITAADLTHTVTHTAGKTDLTQEPGDYIARFALPNMIFHLSLAYAGLRHGGLPLGKADFDGLHIYSPHAGP